MPASPRLLERYSSGPVRATAEQAATHALVPRPTYCCPAPCRYLRKPPSAVLWPIRLLSALNCRRGNYFFRIHPRTQDFPPLLFLYFWFWFSSLLLLRTPRGESTNQSTIATAVSTRSMYASQAQQDGLHSALHRAAKHT